MKTYAIGDIHGCSSHLDEALDYIAIDAKNDVAVVHFLGDYIDRGPDSKGVLDRLMAGPANPKHAFVCLRGNHDDWMLTTAQGDKYGDGEHWMKQGGRETLNSFGISNDDIRTLGAARATRLVPAKYIDFIEKCSLYASDAHRYYVHAGFMPGAGPASHPDQNPLVCMWVREEFLNTEYDFGKLVVHGHTPTSDCLPDLRSWRLNIDTKLGKSPNGRLTVASWEGDAPTPTFWQSFPDSMSDRFGRYAS